MSDDVFTRDDNGDLAVRTVGSTGDNYVNKDDVYTRDNDGNLCVRVTGGGDQHNLGYYATPEALRTAYPTANAGDFAIVGSTDTVWIWDDDNSAWVDSDQKGQVTSVNGRTGAVTVSEVPDQTGYSGRVLGTDGSVAGWVVPEQVQRAVMPQASSEESGNIYQFTGTTDANYTNGYFYKCVSDGQNPATYSWTQVSVQPAPSGLPDQTGNAGKFLTTDGTDASWATVNKAQGSDSFCLENIASSKTQTIYYGTYPQIGGSAIYVIQSIGYGYYCGAGNYSVAMGAFVGTGARGIAIGNKVFTGDNTTNAIQLGCSSDGNYIYNFDSNTFKVANANGNYEIMSADGTIPTARLTHTINKYSTMPTAASTNEGWIVQFTGTTDANYTHGYIYECKAQGTDPETYAWTRVDVQPTPETLPSQTGNAYYFLTTDGTTASWTDQTRGFTYTKASGNNTYSIAQCGLYNDAAFSFTTGGSGFRFFVGSGANFRMGANGFYNDSNYSLGSATYPWANAYISKINNGSDITVPNTSGEMAVKSVNTTITLAVANWSSNTQTVSVTGVTATGVIFVSPDPTDQADYTDAGIICSGQAAGTLTFSCDTTPSNDIDVVVVQL